MLRITAVSAGSVEYLLRGSGCTHERAHDLDATRSPDREVPGTGGVAADYFGAAVEHGEAPGRWGGRGLALVGMQAGSVAVEDDVRAIFGKLTHPDGEALGRAPRQFKTTAARVAAALEAEPDASPERRRQIELAAASDGRKAVAYYDMTFSPAKSVSVYYAALMAAGQHEAAAEVVRAHERAVETAMSYAEDHVAWTRTGYHGRTADGRSVGRYEAAEGLIWSAWKHSTNREDEPQIHTHVGVLNRVRTASDGEVRALDGRGFRPVKEAIATAYERALEDELSSTRGVVFGDRPDGKAREILGVDPELCEDASTRRAQVLARSAELSEDYRLRHGREPGPAAQKKIMQAATLETRRAKGAGPAGPAAVAAWGAPRAAQLVATVEAVADAAAAAAIGAGPDGVVGRRLDPADPEQRRELLAAAVADVQADYATWTLGNLVSAIDRRVGTLPGDAAGAARPAYLEELAREAIRAGNAHDVAVLTVPDPVEVPAEYRRAEDGRSIFRPHLDERYATLGQLQAEGRIVTGARQVTAPAMSAAEVVGLREELAAAGLGPDQVDAVAGIVGSGRAGDVLIGPAGTGKSYTVGALAQVWGERFGGRVLGLATSQIAAQVLADDGVPALNTAAFLARFSPDEQGNVRGRVRPGDLYVVDEAGMSSTADLDRIAAIVRDGGGKIVYTGDQHQLASVGSGGVLALLAADNGAHELAEVHRFRHGWEREASLRLRAGDTSVITDYEDRGRLRGGTQEQMQAAALRGYLADTLAERESLLIVGTNADAAAMSREIRERLIDYGRVSAERVAELGPLAGRAAVGVGDVVQARRVDRSIPVQGGPHVANRATYTVLGRGPGGTLRVRGTAGEIVDLPASYVAHHLTLAYASTVHAAQGRTVDTSHAVLDEGAAREAAYVALTRGRESNTAYLTATRDPDAHDVERLDTTAAGRLASVLSNVEARHAAEVERRIGVREGASLAWVGGQWDEVARDAARDRYTDALLDVLGPEALDALTAEPGWPRLLRAVREAELGGHHGPSVLAEAVTARSLGDADQVSDVLRWRVRTMTADRVPEQHVDPGNWAALAPPTDGPVGQFAQELAVLASDRQHELGSAALTDPPAWAVEQVGPVPDVEDVAEREQWAQRAGAVAAYRELAGLAPDVSIGAAPSREQELHHRMWSAAAAALARPTDAVDYRIADERDLYAARERWAREQTFAPPYVAEEMREAYELADEYAADVALTSARLATLEPTDPEWEPTAEQVERSQRLADLYAEHAEQLEDQHQARAAWYDRTADAREADELARAELARRDLPERRGDPAADRSAPEPTPEPADEELTRTRQPEVDGPEVDGPEVDGPEVDGPEVDGPEVDGPEVDGPEVDGPEVDGPEVGISEAGISEVEVPEVEVPEVEVPARDAAADQAAAELERQAQRARAALDEARRAAETAEREQAYRTAAATEAQAQAEAAQRVEIEAAAEAARGWPDAAQREQVERGQVSRAEPTPAAERQPDPGLGR